VTDANDSFQKLEDKLVRVVELFQQAQGEKRALREEVEQLKAELKERAKRSDALERELHALRREREDLRGRVEKILQQIDVLTKADPGG
jgi:predicted RNase H-like nuclease (RuvC/YqgF family)